MRRETSYLYMNLRELMIITDPLFSQLIPQNHQQIYNSSLKILQQILDEIFSPHLHDLLLEVSSHLEDKIRI